MSSWHCPFCERDLLNAQSACCGEAGHAVEVEEQAEAEQTLQQQQMQADDDGR